MTYTYHAFIRPHPSQPWRSMGSYGAPIRREAEEGAWALGQDVFDKMARCGRFLAIHASLCVMPEDILPCRVVRRKRR